MLRPHLAWSPRQAWSYDVAVPIRIFICDDHAVVRAGVRAVLEAEEDFLVVGEAESVASAEAALVNLEVDVALLDVRLGDGTGIELCRSIRSSHPQTYCLMLTSYADDDALVAAVLAGASGYLLKQVGERDLVGDLRKVARGESLLDPEVTSEVLRQLKVKTETARRLASLTTQERAVFDRIGEGMTNRQIADALYLAEKTVKNYVSSVLAKLGVARRTEAAILATNLAHDTRPSI